MKFKSITRYIIPVEKQRPTGDLNKQLLLYQKSKGRWELVYDCCRDSSGHEHENKRIGRPPHYEHHLPVDGIRTINPTVDPNGHCAIVLEGTTSCDYADVADDNFRLPTAIEKQLMLGIQQIFDEARNHIREQRKALDGLLAKYEQLPIKG